MAELPFVVDIQGKPHHCPRRTLRPTDHNTSPQPQHKTDEKLHTLRKYARDFRRRYTTDTQDFDWDLDDEDRSLVIGCLVVT
jgi:hypothetical protein